MPKKQAKKVVRKIAAKNPARSKAASSVATALGLSKVAKKSATKKAKSLTGKAAKAKASKVTSSRAAGSKAKKTTTKKKSPSKGASSKKARSASGEASGPALLPKTWRPKLDSVLQTGDFRSEDASDLEFAVIGSLPRVTDQDTLHPLNVAQSVFYCVSLFDAQVRNGGLAQWLDNCSPHEIELARKFLKASGALHEEKIVAKALKVLPKGRLAPSKSKHVALMEALSEKAQQKLDTLTDEYYSLDDHFMSRRLLEARIRFMGQNVSDFIAD